MTRWTHRDKEVREALDEAVDRYFTVMPTPQRHGHSWGYIDCMEPGCGQRMYVWSTPEPPANHAKQIRRFLQRHRHPKEA